jgi:hypothetical protein
MAPGHRRRDEQERGSQRNEGKSRTHVPLFVNFVTFCLKKLRPFPLRDLCALVRAMSAPCLPSLWPGKLRTLTETRRARRKEGEGGENPARRKRIGRQA